MGKRARQNWWERKREELAREQSRMDRELERMRASARLGIQPPMKPAPAYYGDWRDWAGSLSNVDPAPYAKQEGTLTLEKVNELYNAMLQQQIQNQPSIPTAMAWSPQQSAYQPMYLQYFNAPSLRSFHLSISHKEHFEGKKAVSFYDEANKRVIVAYTYENGGVAEVLQRHEGIEKEDRISVLFEDHLSYTPGGTVTINQMAVDSLPLWDERLCLSN